MRTWHEEYKEVGQLANAEISDLLDVIRMKGRLSQPCPARDFLDTLPSASLLKALQERGEEVSVPTLKGIIDNLSKRRGDPQAAMAASLARTLLESRKA